jgi:hypothetical protein
MVTVMVTAMNDELLQTIRIFYNFVVYNTETKRFMNNFFEKPKP